MPVNNRANLLDDPHMMPPNLKLLELEPYSAPRAILL